MGIINVVEPANLSFIRPWLDRIALMLNSLILLLVSASLVSFVHRSKNQVSARIYHFHGRSILSTLQIAEKSQKGGRRN